MPKSFRLRKQGSFRPDPEGIPFCKPAIETIGWFGPEVGLAQMVECTAARFDGGFALDGWAWVTNGWEVSLVPEIRETTARLLSAAILNYGCGDSAGALDGVRPERVMSQT